MTATFVYRVKAISEDLESGYIQLHLAAHSIKSIPGNFPFMLPRSEIGLMVTAEVAGNVRMGNLFQVQISEAAE